MKKSIVAGVAGLALGIAVGTLSAQTTQTNGKAFQKSMDGLNQASQFQVRPSAAGEQTVQGAEAAFNHLVQQESVSSNQGVAVQTSGTPEQTGSDGSSVQLNGLTQKAGTVGTNDSQQAEVEQGLALLKQGHNQTQDAAISHKEKLVWFGVVAGGVAAGDYFAFRAGIRNDRYNKLHPGAQVGSMTTSGAVGITIVTSIALAVTYFYLRSDK